MKPGVTFDSLVLRGDRLFGWGWLLDPAGPVRRLEFRIRHGDGSETRLRCQPSGHRPDLAEVYRDIPHAGGAGFLVQGRLRGPAEGALTTVVADFDGGRQLEFDLPGFPANYVIQAGSGGARWGDKWRLARQLLQRGDLPLLARRGWAMVGRRISGWRRRANARRAVSATGAPSVLVFDHAMGGGANHFRNECVARWRAQGRDVVLVTPHLPTQSYEVSCLGAQGERIARHDSLAAALASLPPQSEIVLNSLVSFDDPGRVLDWIIARQQAGAASTYYLHDYHPACPAWTLVDDTGRYCGIPPYERCVRCLAGNEAPFLALMPDLHLPAWRERWGRFLQGASDITAFSQASVDVLRLAFPDLPMARVRLQPHDVSYIRPQPLPLRLGLPLVIGVVGQINAYKGAAIVAEMAALIERERLPARIVVVGSLDNAPVSPVLRITGPYAADELPAILAREQVGIGLLPSIWHETFSYVTAELMAHGLPLAVFDLGAPAERVRAWERGCIIPRIDARTALDSLFTLRERLLAGPVPPAGTPLEPR